MAENLLKSIKIASLFSSMIRKSYGIYIISMYEFIIVNYKGQIVDDLDVSTFDEEFNLLNCYDDDTPILIARASKSALCITNVGYKDMGILTLAEFSALFTTPPLSEKVALKMRIISKIIHVGCPFGSAMHRLLKREMWDLFCQGYALKLYDTTSVFKASEGSECCLFDEAGSRVVFFTWRRGQVVMLDGSYIAVLLAIYKSVTGCIVRVTNETDLYHAMKCYVKNDTMSLEDVINITYDNDGYGGIEEGVSDAYATFSLVQNALYEIPFKLWSEWDTVCAKKKHRKIKNIININERNKIIL